MALQWQPLDQKRSSDDHPSTDPSTDERLNPWFGATMALCGLIAGYLLATLL